MKRINMMLTAGLLAFATTAQADTSGNYDPKPGQWSTVIAIFDNNNNHYLLKTSVNADLTECSDRLHRFNQRLHAANGTVWTSHAKDMVRFEATPGTADVQVKVLDVRCVLEPYDPELVKKF